MNCQVRFTKEALNQFKKLDVSLQKLILSWLKRNLEGIKEPRSKGKALVSFRSGEWHYRIGDFRLIADIQDEIVTILVIDVGHHDD